MHLILHDNDVIGLLEKFGLTRHKNSSFLSQKSVVANHLKFQSKNTFLQKLLFTKPETMIRADRDNYVFLID